MTRKKAITAAVDAGWEELQEEGTTTSALTMAAGWCFDLGKAEGMRQAAKLAGITLFPETAIAKAAARLERKRKEAR